VTFAHEIVDVRTEDGQWVIVQLAGQPELLVFDITIGLTKEVARIQVPASMATESLKFKDFNHVCKNY